MSSSSSRLDSPSVAAGASFKRRSSPPRSPVMLLSQSGPTRPGHGLPRHIIRLAVGALITIPTIYLLFGTAGPTDIDPTYTGQKSPGGHESRYTTQGVARRVKTWGDGKQWFGGSDRWGGESETPVAGGKDEVMIDLEEDIPVSTYDGGIAGYTVFSNLYLSAGSLLFVEPDMVAPTSSQPLPGVRQIMSGPKRPQGGYAAADEDRWRSAGQEVASNELGKRAVFLKGITYIFNDGPGGEGYLIYFRHFVFEAFLGAARVFASVLKGQKLLADSDGVPLPSRLWFPRCGWKPSWRDDRGENAWFIAHALPGATVEDANGWEDRLTAGLPIIFERLVIIDRWSAHSVPGDVSKWGKMNAGVLPLDAPRSFWSSIRTNVMRSMGVDGMSKVGQRGLPVVVYIDVVTGNPKIKDDDRTALVEALKGLTDIAEVHVTKMSAMTKAEQVELMGRAEIVIGLHTDELFTTLWMPATERSTVIELFEEGGFDRGYELLASSLNHKYIVIQNDKIIDEAGWRAIGGKRGDNHNGKIPVDGLLVARVVREQLTGSRYRGEENE